jgi:hypothetical protein
VPRPSFPKTLLEFQTQFETEEACRAYLAKCRWPDGFVCPRCGHRQAYELSSLRHFRQNWAQCATTTHWALLSQPDKQELARLGPQPFDVGATSPLFAGLERRLVLHHSKRRPTEMNSDSGVQKLLGAQGA